MNIQKIYGYGARKKQYKELLDYINNFKQVL